MRMTYRLTKWTYWLYIYCLCVPFLFQRKLTRKLTQVKTSRSHPMGLASNYFWKAAYHNDINTGSDYSALLEPAHDIRLPWPGKSELPIAAANCTEHYVDLYNRKGTTVNTASCWSNIETITHYYNSSRWTRNEVLSKYIQ